MLRRCVTHDQGNNGVEPPMYDKLVEQAEVEIAVLKKPVPHRYEFVKIEGKRRGPESRPLPLCGYSLGISKSGALWRMNGRGL
jgi:hypothetical protein